MWVKKAQEYLADCLGENWQDEYYIWDCCAGTGNLLAGLTNPRNIFASTLDLSDVLIIKEHRVDSTTHKSDNKLNLLKNHIFQFDFLNDDFFDKVDKNGNVVAKSKVPDLLQKILRGLQESALPTTSHTNASHCQNTAPCHTEQSEVSKKNQKLEIFRLRLNVTKMLRLNVTKIQRKFLN